MERQGRRRDPLGPAGERHAARLLRRCGYRVLHRNLRTPVGEADLVCLDPDERTVVIVEVKSRRMPKSLSTAMFLPPPEAAIDARKRSKLVSVAQTVAKVRGWTDRPLRIDVVAIEWPASRRHRPKSRHHKNAVTM